MCDAGLRPGPWERSCSYGNRDAALPLAARLTCCITWIAIGGTPASEPGVKAVELSAGIAFRPGQHQQHYTGIPVHQTTTYRGTSGLARKALMKIHGTSKRTSGRTVPRLNLHKGPAQTGLWVNYRDPAVVETAAAEGFDWICIDGQHGHAELSDYRALFDAAHTFSVPAVVRVPSHEVGHIGRALDAGAQAIIAPTVENASQARNLVETCRFAPRGKRSYGPTRLSPRYPIDIPAAADEPLIILMIETAAGLQNLDEILATEPDGVFVGPYDLALSLGVTLEELTTGAEQHLLRDLVSRSKDKGIAPGIFTGHQGLARQMADIGFRFMPIATDSSLVSTAARGLLSSTEDLRNGL